MVSSNENRARLLKRRRSGIVPRRRRGHISRVQLRACLAFLILQMEFAISLCHCK